MMDMNDRFLIKMINQTKDKLKELTGDKNLDECVEDCVKAMKESSNTAAELRAFRDGMEGNDDEVFTEYVDATIKAVESIGFGVGLLMNGYSSLNEALKKFEKASDKAVAGIEERSGEKYIPEVQEAFDNHMKDQLKKMVLGALAKMIADSGSGDDEISTELDDFVKKMKELEDKKEDDKDA